MDEERFELALEEVEDGEDEGERLKRGGGSVGRVDCWAQEVDEGVDEEGAEVLDYENGAPGDLGTWCGCEWMDGERRRLEERGRGNGLPRSLT